MSANWNWLHHMHGPADEPGRPQAMPVFEGQKLVVVGGSSGMGRQTATDVVAAGGSAVIIGQDPAKVDDTVQTLAKDGKAYGIGHRFHPDAVYRFNIDTDGDALADVAFGFTFSPYDNGRQTGTAYYATGRDAQTREPRGDILIEGTPVGFDATAAPVPAGPCQLFTGARSDPFFADADGVLHWLIDGQQGNFAWTGTDTFAGANILSIAVEAPNDMLGPGPGIGAWITTSLRRDGTLVPMDREGNPSFNPILNADDIKDQFNATDPGRRRPQLPAAAGRNPVPARLPTRRSCRRRPHPAARHPALRPHQASPLPPTAGS
jgi:hypothetical protein